MTVCDATYHIYGSALAVLHGFFQQFSRYHLPFKINVNQIVMQSSDINMIFFYLNKQVHKLLHTHLSEL